MKSKLQRLIDRLLGKSIYYLGGPLHGRTTRMDWPRYLVMYDDDSGKQAICAYRQTCIVKKDGSPLLAYVADSVDGPRALELFDKLPHYPGAAL